MGAPGSSRDKRAQDLRKPPRLKPLKGGPGMGAPDNSGLQNSVFKALRYAPDYPGLQAKNLTPGAPLVEHVKR